MILGTFFNLRKFNREKEVVKDFYIEKGISPETSSKIANELLELKPLETVLAVKYDITLGHYMNSWQAAWSSLFLLQLEDSSLLRSSFW